LIGSAIWRGEGQELFEKALVVSYSYTPTAKTNAEPKHIPYLHLPIGPYGLNE